ncbi:retrovirus poly [Fusarium pseudocircinatum]|uniref:Retrovirus poly n=1 Tax=Fusarium pseudocircinatum TaxID=56676 RepID=A0A8H5PHZ2_9HYPO|nr:retrovirus poly [Fusarium pseudocircinatum]
MYNAASTSQANSHMQEIHRTNENGSMQHQIKKQRTLLDMADLDPHRTKDQALVNAFIASFEPARFPHVLKRWVACDNIPFQKLESPYFGDLTALTVHLLNDEGKFRTFLLGLSRIEGRHGGESLADRVSEILYEYGVEEGIRYFVTDNILLGTDADAFEEDCQADKKIQGEVQLWTSKSPMGILHNIVHWALRPGQRIEKLHKLQSIENTALGFEDKTTRDVVTGNATA